MQIHTTFPTWPFATNIMNEPSAKQAKSWSQLYISQISALVSLFKLTKSEFKIIQVKLRLQWIYIATLKHKSYDIQIRRVMSCGN